MKVLAVDDDEIALELLNATLEDFGYEVATATSGQQAIDLLGNEAIRIVISDWMMPGMDGLALCRWIRSRGAPWYTYVILLTSLRETGDIVAGLSAGADDFLSKPFDPSELEVRIRTGRRILALESRHLVIFALAKLAESRDPETGGHLERMREYSRIIAGKLVDDGALAEQLQTDYAETIYLTSPLHDIGKVGIPDYILLKPGRLSNDEFEVMKRHTLIGGETLQAAVRQSPGADFLMMAADIALTHHEHWDGRGYPHGLKSDAIPLAGRITALADVYDAMTTKRVYKSAYTHDVARGYILDGAGKQFDPVVVEAFQAVETEFRRIRDRFADGLDDSAMIGTEPALQDGEEASG